MSKVGVPGDGPEDADRGEAGAGGNDAAEEAEDAHYHPRAPHGSIGDQQERGDHRKRRPQHRDQQGRQRLCSTKQSFSAVTSHILLPVSLPQTRPNLYSSMLYGEGCVNSI